jgi:hypothetical protein
MPDHKFIIHYKELRGEIKLIAEGSILAKDFMLQLTNFDQILQSGSASASIYHCVERAGIKILLAMMTVRITPFQHQQWRVKTKRFYGRPGQFLNPMSNW